MLVETEKAKRPTDPDSLDAETRSENDKDAETRSENDKEATGPSGSEDEGRTFLKRLSTHNDHLRGKLESLEARAEEIEARLEGFQSSATEILLRAEASARGTEDAVNELRKAAEKTVTFEDERTESLASAVLRHEAELVDIRENNPPTRADVREAADGGTAQVGSVLEDSLRNLTSELLSVSAQVQALQKEAAAIPTLQRRFVNLDSRVGTVDGTRVEEEFSLVRAECAHLRRAHAVLETQFEKLRVATGAAEESLVDAKRVLSGDAQAIETRLSDLSSRQASDSAILHSRIREL